MEAALERQQTWTDERVSFLLKHAAERALMALWIYAHHVCCAMGPAEWRPVEEKVFYALGRIVHYGPTTRTSVPAGRSFTDANQNLKDYLLRLQNSGSANYEGRFYFFCYCLKQAS
jgi:hypothetical protein